MSYHQHQSRTGAFFLTLTLALLAASCGPSETALAKANLNTVGSKDKLLTLIEDSQSRYYPEGPAISEDTAAPLPEDSTGGEEGRDYVDTNVQVEGVDEGDIVKTDGYNIFYAPRYQNRVHVFDVDEQGAIGYQHLIDLDNIHVDSLYLLEDYLVVVGYSFNQSPSCGIETGEGDDYACYAWMWYAPTGTVAVYERDTFSLVYQVETDTNFLDHRMIGDSLFLVGHKYLYNTDVELRPSYTVDGNEAFVDYNEIYYFDDTLVNGMSVLTGIHFDQNPSNISLNAKAYLGAGYGYKQIYVSLTDLYVSDTNYIYEDTRYYQTMTISQYRLDIDHADFEFVAAGIVEGGMLNQFSMDYYQGYLRVATTNQGARWTISSNNEWEWQNYERIVDNHLYVLKLNANKDGFNLIAHLSEGLGKPQESIQSVRFLGHKAYIVTFLRTDPLYIIDLSDPANPTITDEIHLPGYDTYQHPWGENYLLGIGYQADENGFVEGMKMTAYNTTSGGALELQTRTLDVGFEDEENAIWTYSYSEALWNHKALLVSPEHHLFGFPVQGYEYGYLETPVPEDDPEESGSYGDWYFRYHSYYYLFKIDFSRQNPIPEPVIIEHPVSENYYVGVDRAVMIENFVYTLSDHQVVTYDLVNDIVLDTVLDIPYSV